MLRLKSKNRVPPKGFRWKDPLTGWTWSHHNYDVWASGIAKHREANNLPAVDMAEAEHQNCLNLGPSACDEFCADDNPLASVNGISLHAEDIARGTEVIARFKLAGSPLVPMEEAERRASICATCYRNVSFKKPCSGICGALLSIVEKLVGGARTSQHDRLNACSVCSCSLIAKIHIPMDILKKTETPEQQSAYPDFCWQKSNEL